MKPALVLGLISAAFLPLAAQSNPQIGVNRWGSYKSFVFGTVDRGDLNSHFEIPIFNRQTVGSAQLNLRLTYDSQFWSGFSGGQWQPAAGFGWRLAQAEGQLVTNEQDQFGACGWYDPNNPQDGDDGSGDIYNYIYTFYEPDGTPARAGGFTIVDMTGPPLEPYYKSDCGDSSTPGGYLIPDGKGFTVITNGDGSAEVYDAAGDEVDAGFRDRNGNTVSSVSSGGATTFSDPLGTAVTETGSGTSTSPLVFTYTGPNSTPEHVTAQFESFPVATGFACTGIADWSGNATVPSELDLPDGTKYLFGYDGAGRLTSVTLPTGGVITYAYTLDCADAGNSHLTRSTSVCSGSWTWTRTHPGGTTVETTESDPTGYAPSFTFPAFNQAPSFISYPFHRIITVATSTNSAGVSEQTTTTQLTDGAAALYSVATTAFDPFGRTTTASVTDWGTSSAGGNLLRSTTTSFSVVNGYIDQTNSVIVSGPNGQAAETTYTWDGNGNLLGKNDFSAPGVALTHSFTYNPNGTVATATDANGTVSTYTYGACNGLFPTAVTNNKITAITSSATWDCTGGVPLTQTGSNNDTTSISYVGDPLWRPTSVTAPDGGVTNITYTANSIERAMPFNNNASTTDVLTTLDGLGRAILSQRRQGPGATNFDSVETFFDALGRATAVTMPYVGTAGQTAPSGTPQTTTTFDALSRPVKVVDGGGGEVDTSYSANDVLRTVLGTPNVARQQEFDGLGRLTSVCEITAGTSPWPAGACGQSTSASGYLTKYTRNPLGEITQVLQNAQGSTTETRGFAFDELGRLTSETNPETGTTSYVYDSGACGLSSSGDLIERTDAMGNVTCYAHDALHRVTGISYPSGPYAGVTPTKTFVYDSGSGYTFSNVPGYSPANQMGRLVLAYTGSGNGPATQEGFGYDISGQPIWRAHYSSNSSTWLTSSESYFPNGAPATLAIPGLAAVAYGLDGEGRPSSVSVGGEQVASAVLSPEGPKSATLPGGGDSFGYNPGNGRLSQYQFNAAAGTDTGNLTWNPDGSLKSLAINDTIPGTGDTGTCSYTQDDLGRVASVSCPAWSQTFAMDAFGNVAKSGSISFSQMPGGFNANNQIIANGSFTSPNYDADGNLLDDPVIPQRNTNAFDSEGRPVKLEGASLTYGGLEQRVATPGGDYIYLPDGRFAAEVAGTSDEFVDLPGGDTAVYQNGGLQYIRRADWLGSGRLLTTPAGALFWSTGYAPYGETNSSGGPTPVASFAGQDLWDASTANYGFPLREYNGIQGRWWSPDPAGLAAVDPNNPQSWNRYSYVNGNPLNATDPTGEKVVDCMWDGCPVPGCPECSTGGGGGGVSYGVDAGSSGFIDTGWVFQISNQMESRYLSLITTGWDPELDRYDPPDQGHGDISACEDKVLAAVNQQFGTSFTEANAIRAQTDDGGEYNVTVTASGLSAIQFNAINEGRYASVFTMLTGIGPSLHITGATALDPTAIFSKLNNGSEGGTSITFTAHIDNGYAYNPIGFLSHVITDILNSSSRSSCP